MNTLKNLEFSTEKANAVALKKTDKIQQMAVALGKGAVMKKHKTSVPAFLLVLEGEIKFILPSESFDLKKFDFFEIPIDVEHEVIGIQNENLFIVTKEL